MDRPATDVDSTKQLLESEETDAIFALSDADISQTNKLDRYHRRNPQRFDPPAVEVHDPVNETKTDDSVTETD